MSRFSLRSWMTLFVAPSALSLVACQEAPEARAQEANVQAASSAVAAVASAPLPAAPAALSGQPSYKEEAFELKLSAPAQGKVGESVEVTIELVPTSGYKVNLEYPIKFAFVDGEGVTAEPNVLKKEQATLDKTRAVLKGKVKLSQPGERALGGKLSFSVCTEERCLIEKRDLRVTVNAS